MKTINLIPVACFIALFSVSCEMDDIPCVRVDGPIETQKRTLSDFNSIFFGDVGNLHISQGNEYSFIMKGQRVILDKVDLSVENNNLIIQLNECFNGDGYSLDIFITAPEIVNIEMSGIGTVTTETPLSADVFSLKLSGVSEMNSLEIEADSMTTYHLGTGTIQYSGNTRAHTILSSGVGEIKADNLTTKTTEVTSNTTGDTYVNVSEKLIATLNNTGNVYYKGSPEITKEETGTGRVINNN